MSALFSPLTLGPLKASGRVFKSATSETRADESGCVTDDLLSFYEPIAQGGTPLIITGYLYVSEQGKAHPGQAGIDTDDKTAGLRAWAAVLKSRGGLAVAQINHAGRQIGGAKHAVSASDVREPLMGTKPRALRRDELPTVIESYAAGAERAADAGFDGVQIHCAHGYLLSQFLTPHTNRRTDDYGGTLENRARLILEIVRAVRERVGDQLAVLAKINGTDALPLRPGATTAEQVQVASWMQEEGLDAIEISRGHYESGPGMVAGRYGGFLTAQVRHGGATKLPAWRRAAGYTAAPVIERGLSLVWPAKQGFNLPQAQQFTAALEIPVICVGGFVTAEAMSSALDAGRCAAVSVARAMIADPYLYRHLREPDEQAPVCGFCNGCIARAGGTRIDCYSEEIRARRDAMLAATDNDLTITDPTARS
jgi:2,4-dienoyl-CoA reductase-like NADH-dependent reductase (Old Yellow Enzyme family)